MSTIQTPTPGPWGWFGNTKSQILYLSTVDRGRQFVMQFKRWGTGSGQPVFQVNNRMVPAKELVKFEVGDGKARGHEHGLDDPSVYRMDVLDIDHPDARLIVAAPDLLAACTAMLATWGSGDEDAIEARDMAKAAIEKVTSPD